MNDEKDKVINFMIAFDIKPHMMCDYQIKLLVKHFKKQLTKAITDYITKGKTQ